MYSLLRANKLQTAVRGLLACLGDHIHYCQSFNQIDLNGYLLRTWQERLTDTEKRKREELEELKVCNSPFSHIPHSHTTHIPTVTHNTHYHGSSYSQRAGTLKVDNRLPNLVNLNEDPQLSDLLLYILKDGI